MANGLFTHESCGQLVNMPQVGIIEIDMVLWANSADDISEKTGFDSSRKLSSLETICMKCQTYFGGIEAF